MGRPLRTSHAPACHHCTLARGAGPVVEIYTTHERVICPDHGLWIGDGTAGPSDQFSIRACPQISAAWHHHRNLITRHGHSRVRKAYHVANAINWGWYHQFQHFGPAMDTYDKLAAGKPLQASKPGLVAVALYPSAVALTAAIASPYWTGIALSPRPAAFLDRISVEVTEGWVPRGACDPLRHWMETNWPPGVRGSDTLLSPTNR